MFDKYCWAYNRSVNHRNVNLDESVKPSGKASLDLHNTKNERMSSEKFKKDFCSNCKSESCKIYQDIFVTLEKIGNPEAIPATTGQSVTDKAKDGEFGGVHSLELIANLKKNYFDAPSYNIDISKISGRVKSNISKNALICQSLLMDFDNGYTALLFFDNRECPSINITCGIVPIKINVSGSIMDFGDINIIKMNNTDSFMSVFNIGKVTFNEAVYCVKAAFRRVADVYI